MTFIKIFTKLMAAAPIILSPIEIFINFTSTTLSIMTPTEKSTKPIIKDMYPNFIIHQPPTIYAITGKSIFLTSSIENGKVIK